MVFNIGMKKREVEKVNWDGNWSEELLGKFSKRQVGVTDASFFKQHFVLPHIKYESDDLEEVGKFIQNMIEENNLPEDTVFILDANFNRDRTFQKNDKYELGKDVRYNGHTSLPILFSCTFSGMSEGSTDFLLNPFCLNESNKVKFPKKFKHLNVYFITNGGHRMDFFCKLFNNHPTQWLYSGKSPFEFNKVDAQWHRLQEECELNKIGYNIRTAFNQLADVVKKNSKRSAKELKDGHEDFQTQTQMENLTKIDEDCKDLKRMVDWVFNPSNHHIILRSLTPYGTPPELEKIKYQQTNSSAINTPTSNYKLHSIASTDAYADYRENFGDLITELTTGTLKID